MGALTWSTSGAALQGFRFSNLERCIFVLLKHGQCLINFY
jgi:hypothetical protein